MCFDVDGDDRYPSHTNTIKSPTKADETFTFSWTRITEYVFFFFFCCFHLEHRASVRRCSTSLDGGSARHKAAT
jgi:hypothetical protein